MKTMVHITFSTLIILLLTIKSVESRPKISFDCMDKCNTDYEACHSGIQNIEEKIVCFNAKLTCLVKCRTDKVKQVQKRLYKRLMKNQLRASS